MLLLLLLQCRHVDHLNAWDGRVGHGCEIDRLASQSNDALQSRACGPAYSRAVSEQDAAC